MEWWEYLIVIVAFVFLLPVIYTQVERSDSVELDNRTRSIHKREFGLILISLCLFLLMLITYKLFIA